MSRPIDRWRGFAGRALLWAVAAIGFLLLTAACVVLPDPRGNLPQEGGCKIVQGDTSATPAQYAAFVATTDYALAGGFGIIDLNTLCTYSPDPVFATQVVSPDPVARAFGDYIFVINRFTYDNVSVLNQDFHLVSQYSVAGPGCDPSNPHDLEFVSESKAYLSRYECRDLWIINPVTGQRLGAIDLAAAGYGGVDGIPEMSGLLLHGDTLYVAVQLMDRRSWKPEGPGRLVMVNTITDTVEGDVVLAGKNPVTDVVYSAALDRILVGTVGSYTLIGDGGIEAMDPASGAALGFVIDETALAGNLGDFEIATATRGYATITTASLRSVLIGFDPSTGTRDPGIIYAASAGFSLWDIALTEDGDLYVGDRTATSPGVVVIDTVAMDTILTPQPLDLGFPPFSIVFLR